MFYAFRAHATSELQGRLKKITLDASTVSFAAGPTSLPP